MNALFRAGDVVIRIGRPSAPAGLAIELAARLRDRGIPAPTPASEDVLVDGELAATCWIPLAESGERIDWVAIGAIVRRVHTLTPADLPDGYPVPPPTAFPWWDFDALMADIGGEIDDAARAGLEQAIARNAAWRMLEGAHVVCHGDVHPGNVMMTADGPVLIDWDLMCTAPSGWDHAMLLTLAERWGGDPSVYPDVRARLWRIVRRRCRRAPVRRTAQRGRDADACPRRTHGRGRSGRGATQAALLARRP